MRYIQKTSSLPADTQDFFNRHKNEWVKLPETERTSLIQQLETEQKGVCCYCCRTIKNKPSRIEHLASRKQHRHKIHDYDNLLLSCTEPNQCDNAKGSTDIPMTPLEMRCNSAIKINQNGVLITAGIDKDKTDAEQSIDVLQLNNKNEQNRRRAIINEIESYLVPFAICQNLYELKQHKQQFFKIIKDFPQFEEMKYIIEKLT